MVLNKIEHIFNKFQHEEIYKSHAALTDGHINDTYKIETTSGNDFVLQRINNIVFPNAEKLIRNKASISNYLYSKSEYIVAQYLKTNTNSYSIIDGNSSHWTLCNFIKNTRTYKTPKSYDIAEEAGKLLGDFHKSIRYYNVTSLFESIPDFHNLSYRETQFKQALENANNEIIKEVKKEIELINRHRKDAEYLDVLKTSGRLPLRVTHNDAKLSNMLFLSGTDKAAAIIDFDTIMPGIIHYDIGDAVRSICSTADEDELDDLKIDFNLDYYRAFIKGFLSIINTELTILEKETISLSIRYMLYEQAIRFLTDYLNGNIYYKIDYPKHNLARTRNQLRLLEIVDIKFDKIVNITNQLTQVK